VNWEKKKKETAKSVREYLLKDYPCVSKNSHRGEPGARKTLPDAIEEALFGRGKRFEVSAAARGISWRSSERLKLLGTIAEHKRLSDQEVRGKGRGQRKKKERSHKTRRGG